MDCPDTSCEYNNVKMCGRSFCMLPRCIKGDIMLRALKPCKYSGCIELTRDISGYCQIHNNETKQTDYAKQYDKRRGSPSSRGYDKVWERLRIMYLYDNPLCEDCLEHNILTQAAEVHHVVKIRSDIGRRLDQDNLRALCKSCHSVRTARGE